MTYLFDFMENPNHRDSVMLQTLFADELIRNGCSIRSESKRREKENWGKITLIHKYHQENEQNPTLTVCALCSIIQNSIQFLDVSPKNHNVYFLPHFVRANELRLIRHFNN